MPTQEVERRAKAWVVLRRGQGVLTSARAGSLTFKVQAFKVQGSSRFKPDGKPISNWGFKLLSTRADGLTHQTQY